MVTLRTVAYFMRFLSCVGVSAANTFIVAGTSVSTGVAAEVTGVCDEDLVPQICHMLQSQADAWGMTEERPFSELRNWVFFMMRLRHLLPFLGLPIGLQRLVCADINRAVRTLDDFFDMLKDRRRRLTTRGWRRRSRGTATTKMLSSSQKRRMRRKRAQARTNQEALGTAPDDSDGDVTDFYGVTIPTSMRRSRSA
mmetsp:Transcript_25811/g.74552  ORF Transcript_25811/g.74552 Transcript_25811/m.74552 type:complete len:196 (+) Transcript_25811:434-1021(+)